MVPRFTSEQARELAGRLYGLSVSARELPSYVDQNFRLTDESGAEFVLKILSATEDPGILDAQVAALELLGGSPGLLPTPRPIPCTTGDRVTREADHAVWLVSWLPGVPLGELAEQPPDLLRDLGRGLGDLDRRLASFEHPAVRRIYPWDLRNAPGALSFTDHIADPERRALARAGLIRFESRTLPGLDRLPFQVIHNDANDYNVLVSETASAAGGTRIAGLLDFGDMVWTARACEPAIAVTYAMMAAEDPLAAGAHVLAGYHEELALGRDEIGAVPYLIEARLCVSVTMSSYRRNQDPDNVYLSVSEAAAWRLLEWMSGTPPDRWVDPFEEACASR